MTYLGVCSMLSLFDMLEEDIITFFYLFLLLLGIKLF
jgi:hypothetical protein